MGQAEPKIYRVGAGPILVGQISRGVCPSLAVAEACGAARFCGWGYMLVAYETAAAAKELLASVAKEEETGLLLIEDDIIADAETWLALSKCKAAVAFAPTVMHNHRINTRRAEDGRVLYSGSAFVRISAEALQALPDPVFAHGSFYVEDGLLVHRGPGVKGRGSDVHLWWRLQEAGITDVVELPAVDHIAHHHNGSKGGYALDRPHTYQVYEVRD